MISTTSINNKNIKSFESLQQAVGSVLQHNPTNKITVVLDKLDFGNAIVYEGKSFSEYEFLNDSLSKNNDSTLNEREIRTLAYCLTSYAFQNYDEPTCILNDIINHLDNCAMRKESEWFEQEWARRYSVSQEVVKTITFPSLNTVKSMEEALKSIPWGLHQFINKDVLVWLLENGFDFDSACSISTYFNKSKEEAEQGLNDISNRLDPTKINLQVLKMVFDVFYS